MQEPGAFGITLLKQPAVNAERMPGDMVAALPALMRLPPGLIELPQTGQYLQRITAPEYLLLPAV